MKRIAVFALIVISCLILLLPVSAEKTTNDLKNVFTSLNTYVVPYLQKDERFPTFRATLDELDLFLKNSGQTQAEIDAMYQKIINEYALLMRSAFDYSALEEIAESYRNSSSLIFTAESWAPLEQAAYAVSEELAKPTLFGRNAQTSDEEYQKAIDDHIKPLINAYVDAYNKLVLDLPEKDITRPQYNAYVRYVRSSVPLEIFAGTTDWFEFNTLLVDKEDMISWRYPAQWRLDETPGILNEAYSKLFLDTVDFTEAKLLLEGKDQYDPAYYTAESWARYEAALETLRVRTQTAVFLYFPATGSNADYMEQINLFLFRITSPVLTAKEQLVTLEQYQTLESLYQRYSQCEKVTGLDAKWKNLTQALREAEELMQNPEAGSVDFINLASILESTGENYLLAAENFKNEQNGNLQSNIQLMRTTGVIALAIIGVSLICACIFSYRANGRMNWSQ